MVEASDEPSLIDRIRSKAYVSKLGLGKTDPSPVLPLKVTKSRDDARLQPGSTTLSNGSDGSNATRNNVADGGTTSLSPPAPPPTTTESGDGEKATSIERDGKPNIAIRFYNTTKEALLSSIFNILLVFVPVGIAVQYAGVNPIIVFAMNAIAIIPLAGLLAHATESVASSLGDTVGALLNVTFGNAVELIIFIALQKNEIRIVQASLVGSILSNLLLILGMCFLFGGLRFREQIYNSTVTQMSACLLSLSVTSLLLPTAFHASFSEDNSDAALTAVIQISRGSSIILLFIYVLYLLFQLKSHAYMYESTPQHVIDEESHPGVLAEILNSSSSSDSSSSSSSDSDGSSGSHTTANRIKRAFRGRGRRKSSASSKDSPSIPSTIHSISNGTFNEAVKSPNDPSDKHFLGAIASGDEADDDKVGSDGMRRLPKTDRRDFEAERTGSGSKSPKVNTKKKSKKKHKRKRRLNTEVHDLEEEPQSEKPEGDRTQQLEPTQSPRVAFVQEIQTVLDGYAKRPFPIRALSSVRPAMPKMLSSTVFSTAYPTGPAAVPTVPSVPRAPYGLRRTSSLPDRLNKAQSLPVAQPMQRALANRSTDSLASEASAELKPHMSRTSAVILLLISTGLVALCAEYLVGSINYLVDNTDVSQVFIGLIILPIVGNAAEHVTAVTVASKNKMDLAIGVAVGSSIQIALFVTPVIVLLGWCLNRDMSLYFSLFETISLFVSAFIVNFLVLDGRSNYLEGALLIAAYTIIAVAAFFYPDSSQQSVVGGGAD